MPHPPDPTPDPALFGKNNTPRIIDVLPLTTGPRASHDRALLRRYERSEDGKHITSEDIPFFPFFFLSDITLLRNFPRDRYKFQQLEGDNFYQYLVAFNAWPTYWDAVREVEQTTEHRERRPDELYLINTPVQQYLMQTGQTCFKGMDFDDLHRLQLDIEALSGGGFPDAEHPEDAVMIVALSDNRGWKQLLHLAPGITVANGMAFETEVELLHHLVMVIRERNPDVIEGHNIYNFDFPYLTTRCIRHNIPFIIGRDDTIPRTFSSSMRFAERSIDFQALDIAGRHVIDTFFQVMSYDVFKRNLPAYGLKAVARYFGFAPEDRTYVEGGEISRVWKEDPARVLAYALDDVIETERLARHLSGSTFYLTQMLPMPYGQVARTGPAAKIESLFVREYLRQRQSLPKSKWGSQVMGGYTDVFFTGVTGPIIYADVESLYPSIMLNYDIRPGDDALGVFPRLLHRLTDLRLDAKTQMQQAATPEARSALDARQSSYKNLINSFYGNLGFSHALFNDFAEADRVAATGQDILRSIIALIVEAGGRVLEVDTDGVLFVPPAEVRGEAAELAFVEAMNEEMPEGIRIGFDGRFRKMLSYKKKNYALLGYDDQLKLKGSSLVSRSTERFGRRFVKRAIRLLLDEDLAGLHTLYLNTRGTILTHAWTDAQDFSRTETLKDTVEHYVADVEAGKRARAASYELAIRRFKATGFPIRKGDRITYYLTGTTASITAFEHARFAQQWDPNKPDENTAYYLKRLDEATRKFEPFFSKHNFRLLFSPEDLFGFSAKGIRLLSHEKNPKTSQDEIPF